MASTVSARLPVPRFAVQLGCLRPHPPGKIRHAGTAELHCTYCEWVLAVLRLYALQCCCW